VTKDAQVDPELAAFNIAAAAMTEKNRQEHRDWLLRDLATTSGAFILPH
jgi:hypothetical protein